MQYYSCTRTVFVRRSRRSSTGQFLLLLLPSELQLEEKALEPLKVPFLFGEEEHRRSSKAFSFKVLRLSCVLTLLPDRPSELIVFSKVSFPHPWLRLMKILHIDSCLFQFKMTIKVLLWSELRFRMFFPIYRCEIFAIGRIRLLLLVC